MKLKNLFKRKSYFFPEINSEITHVGEPCQFYEATGNGTWNLHPAIISDISRTGGEYNELRVFPVGGGKSYIVKNVRSVDFRKLNEHFWQPIPK